MLHRILFMIALSLATYTQASAEEAPAPTPNPTPNAPAITPLDTSLKTGTDDDISNVFRDMGVVQRKAMSKRGKFLVSTFGTLDFSDGPYTNYALNINPGYAISDFLEVYVQFSPYYLVQKRSIVDLVGSLTLNTNEQAQITAAKPKYQYGFEVLWAPLYGKDSLGISKIIRSDTFLKVGASKIQYDTTSGIGMKAGVGKTFFLSKSAGLRFCIDYGLIQSTVGVGSTQKSFKSMFLLEIGANFYI
jgi:outer membrane beta-barrel protein